MSFLWVIILSCVACFVGYLFGDYKYSVYLLVGGFIGILIADIVNYNKANEGSAESLKVTNEIKEGEYRPIIIKIDINEMGGYNSIVYNRHGVHLTKENRQHFINLLNHIIAKERDLRSHSFKLLTFRKDD